MSGEPAATEPAPPLRGFRVLDFTAMMAGPYCARWLADLGADVIKIEPLDGDYMRGRPPLRDGASAFYGHLNAGKRSIALDLKSPRAVQIVKDLAQRADVVIEAFRPGVMRRLGLGADDLRSLHAGLVYCSISGFGQNTSASSLPAYAYMVQASCGYDMANFDYQDGLDRPPNSGIPLADTLTGMFAAMAIQTSLLARERNGGHGAVLDVNLMDSMVNMLAFELQAAQFPQPGRRPLYKPMRASDGFVMVTVVNDKNFRSLCEATGHPEWRDDPLLATDPARLANWAEYMDRIEQWTCRRSAEECERVLMAAGVPCARYRRVDEAMLDPQFAERGAFATVADRSGAYRVTNLPFAVDGATPQAGGRVASLGADTREVLGAILQMSGGEIDRLAAEGVLSLGEQGRAASS